MKRLFSLLLAGCMLASVTAFASENNTITGGTATVTGSTDVAKPSVGDTLVEYTTAKESYTITIPTKITIENTSGNRVSKGEDKVTLSEVFLANGKALQVTAMPRNADNSADNDAYKLFLQGATDVSVDYKLTTSNITSNHGTAGDLTTSVNTVLKNVGTQENLGNQQDSDKAIATLKASIASDYNIPAVGTYQANVRFTVAYGDPVA